MREGRASFGESTIRAYQAYSHSIADGALKAQAFIAPFSRGSHDLDQTFVLLDDVPFRLGKKGVAAAIAFQPCESSMRSRARGSAGPVVEKRRWKASLGLCAYSRGERTSSRWS